MSTSTTPYPVNLSFDGGDISRPRWEIVLSSLIYNQITEERFTLGPAFRARPEVSFSMQYTITTPGIHFTDPGSYASYSSQSPSTPPVEGPLTFMLIDDQNLLISSQAISTDFDWARFTVQIVVEDAARKKDHVSFVLILVSTQGSAKLRQQFHHAVGLEPPSAHAAGAGPADEEQAGPLETLLVTVVPSVRSAAPPAPVEYPSLFDYVLLTLKPLPSGVFVDPWVRVKRAGTPLSFDLSLESGTLRQAVGTTCNPSPPGNPGVALSFFGVTDAKPNQMNCPVGFEGSRLNTAHPERGSVFWDKGGLPTSFRAASFYFFIDQGTGGSEEFQGMADPTVIVDPPPGG